MPTKDSYYFLENMENKRGNYSKYQHLLFLYNVIMTLFWFFALLLVKAFFAYELVNSFLSTNYALYIFMSHDEY